MNDDIRKTAEEISKPMEEIADNLQKNKRFEMEKGSFNIDSFIKKLLSVRGKKNMQVKLKEKNVTSVCNKAK